MGYLLHRNFIKKYVASDQNRVKLSILKSSASIQTELECICTTCQLKREIASRRSVSLDGTWLKCNIEYYG